MERGHWISVATLADGSNALRACITNHTTSERDIDALIATANDVIG